VNIISSVVSLEARSATIKLAPRDNAIPDGS